jgi:hypothetical protein
LVGLGMVSTFSSMGKRWALWEHVGFKC